MKHVTGGFLKESVMTSKSIAEPYVYPLIGRERNGAAPAPLGDVNPMQTLECGGFDGHGCHHASIIGLNPAFECGQLVVHITMRPVKHTVPPSAAAKKFNRKLKTE